MRHFNTALTAAALASLSTAQFDCSSVVGTTQAICNQFPSFAEVMNDNGAFWDL